jgi:hypothetical protein
MLGRVTEARGHWLVVGTADDVERGRARGFAAPSTP